MPALLRKRLVCFYCNHKSALTRDPSLRKFRCNNCDAVNYLDENGEITDPPSISTTQSRTYATVPGTGVNPDFAPADENIFCDTCLKNQQFYVNALASYLPDPSDPDYAKYEAKLPEYKANLEKRYPQVCSRCVERVNNRIKSMTYLTKAENLKVSLDRTRKKQFVNRETGWKGTIVFLGMCLWHTSVLGQCLWHYMGIMSLRSLSQVPVNQQTVSIKECASQVARFDSLDTACFNSMTENLPIFLLSGLLSFWWNNRLRESIQGYGRLSHLNDYYMVQAIFLAVRYAAYWIISNPKRITLPLPIIAVHAFMIIFSLICTISSKTIVQIRKRPVLADYKLRPVEAPEPEETPLTLDGPLNQATTGKTQPSLSSMPSLAYSGGTISTLNSQTYHPEDSGFPISALSLSPQQQQTGTNPSIWTPRTRQRRSPSMTSSSAFSAFLDDRVDEDEQLDQDVSEMDWTPTGPVHPSLTPSRPMLERIPESDKKSPSKGLFSSGVNLPPAPSHPAHRAVKPSGRIGAFEERGMRVKGGLLADESESEIDQDKRNNTGLFGRKGGKNKSVGLTSKLASRKEIPMAAPKFHLSTGKGESQEEETGLEGLFNSVFSLSDAPSEVQSAVMHQGNIHNAGPRVPRDVRQRQGNERRLFGTAVWITVAVAVFAGVLGAIWTARNGGIDALKGAGKSQIQNWHRTSFGFTPEVIPEVPEILDPVEPEWQL